ncbi:jg22867, partial [Pararge aegeria aegeria]
MSTGASPIELLYQNVRGLRTKTEMFRLNILNHRYDLILITESWLTEGIYDREICDDRYDVLRCDRNSKTSTKKKGGGVLLCARKELNIQLHREWTCPGVESLWATIPAQSQQIQGTRNIHIGLIYAPPDNILPTRLESISSRLAELIAQYPNDYIILAGDFNLPNVTWSDSGPTIRKRGPVELHNAFMNIIDICNLSGLKQLNTIPNSKHNTLDLLFSNIDFSVNHCPNPLVPEDTFHPCLQFNLSNLLLRNTRQKPVKKPNFFKGDYRQINEHLSNINWHEALSAKSMNDVVEIFYSILNEAIKRFVPVKVKYKSNFPVWYSKPLIHIVKDKLRKHKEWKVYKNPRDYDEFAILRARQKQIQNKCYTSYIQNMQTYIAKDPKLLFSFTKSLRNSKNGYPTKLTLGNTVYTDEESACYGFSEYFESVFAKPASSYDAMSHSNSSYKESICKITIDENTVLKLLKTLKTNKGAGSDGIPPIFLTKCATNLAKPLTIIFNLSLNVYCSFPDIWKQALIVPIHKSGSKTQIENYRPISILNVMSKLFESVIYSYISPIISRSIPYEQHGFMKNRSTVTNLAVFTDYVLRSMDERCQV